VTKIRRNSNPPKYHFSRRGACPGSRHAGVPGPEEDYSKKRAKDRPETPAIRLKAAEAKVRFRYSSVAFFHSQNPPSQRWNGKIRDPKAELSASRSDFSRTFGEFLVFRPHGDVARGVWEPKADPPRFGITLSPRRGWRSPAGNAR
jgi:hypothetical protein